MREIKKYIEQLEEAAKFLAKKTPTEARLALLLIDNLAELFMYNEIREIFARDDYIKVVIKPKYSIKKREKIEKHFKDKCNFLTNYIKIISNDSRNILVIGHCFRNEAYHNGVIRDNIILNIARTYFKAICKVLPILWSGSCIYSNINEIENFLQKYNIKGNLINREILNKICNILLEENKCTTPELCKKLSEDLLKRIEDLINDLDDLSSNVYKGKEKEEILKELQFSKESIIENNIPETEESVKEFLNKREKLLVEYNPSITLCTIKKWREIAINIRSEKLSGSAMRKFYNIDKKLLTINNMVEDVFLYLDRLVDLEINHRLNK